MAPLGGVSVGTPDDPSYPADRAPHADTFVDLEGDLVACRACPRLVTWRERVAHAKRRAFRDWEYWAKPVPGFGPIDATVAIVGLAPAAHGGNRTGRIFTGDPSGDVLHEALHAVGMASQPTSQHRGDGLELRGVRITVPVHCAPPDNLPTTSERNACRPWLARELELLRPTLRVVVVLGGFAWRALLPVLEDGGWSLPRPRPAFGYGAHVRVEDPWNGGALDLLGCYHPSQRNVSTGTLTIPMVHDVLWRAARLAWG